MIKRFDCNRNFKRLNHFELLSRSKITPSPSATLSTSKHGLLSMYAMYLVRSSGLHFQL